MCRKVFKETAVVPGFKASTSGRFLANSLPSVGWKRPPRVRAGSNVPKEAIEGI